MRTPATALLWECWRLSRWYLAFLIFFPTLLGASLLLARLVVPDAESAPDLVQGPTTTLLFSTLAGILGGIWAMNIDRRGGFKLALGFARPIPTWVLATVPMVYIGLSCAVVYLVPMLVLRAAFDVPFPLFPMAALIATLGLVNVAVDWWTADSARRRMAWTVLWLVGWLWIFREKPFGSDPSHWAENLSFSAGIYGLMALVSVVAIGVTIAGVARQRRGDNRRLALAPAPGRAGSMLTGGLGMRWVASPTRAQLWLEMRTAGAAVVKSGVLVALLAPLAMMVMAPPSNPFAFGAVMLILSPIVGLRSILDVRRKQGRSDLGSFAATRAMGTARLVGLKVLVSSLSVIAAWLAIATSLWIFVVRLAVWGPGASTDLAEFVRSLPAGAWVGIVVAVVTAMAGGLALHALLILNARRVILSVMAIGTVLPLSLGIAFLVGEPTAILMALAWIVTGAAAVGVAVLLRRLVAERIFTWRDLAVVLGMWVGIALMSPSGLPWLAISCLPLVAATLAPWSFSRLRHR